MKTIQPKDGRELFERTQGRPWDGQPMNTTETKHTPGPWTYIYSGTCLDLIRSAPELLKQRDALLAALQNIESRLDRWLSYGIDVGSKGRDNDWLELREQARAVLAKATGKTI